MFEEYKKCLLCARGCGVDRYEKTGFCNMTDEVYVSHSWLHMWEEPPISGTKGSGTIFFDGCSLGCVFCQNAKISRGRNGKSLSVDQLADLMLNLYKSGAHNINFVTPTHFSPSIKAAIVKSRAMGVDIPMVYNTGSYDTPDSIRKLKDHIDVYLPDFKYYKSKTAKEYSCAEDYPLVSKAAIDEMVKQTGRFLLDKNGLIKKGVIVRILLLPSHVAEAKLCLKYIHSTYGDDVMISLMNQYTPMSNMKPPLNRRVTKDEYNQLVDYAYRLGVKYAFVQEFGTADKSFIPPF